MVPDDPGQMTKIRFTINAGIYRRAIGLRYSLHLSRDLLEAKTYRSSMLSVSTKVIYNDSLDDGAIWQHIRKNN